MIIIPVKASIKRETQVTVRHAPTHEHGARRSSRAEAVAAAAAAVAAGLTGCGSTAAGSTADTGPSVVATTTVLGDVTTQVARCGGLEVRTLMPAGADPHDYAPSSADVRDLVRADLVVANGLGLEEGLAAALDSARADGAHVLEVAPLVDPIPMSDAHEHADEHDGEGSEHEHEHEHGSLDPHVWLDAGRMATAARLIGDELAEITGDDALAACGTQVAADLDTLDDDVRETLAAVPAGSRVLITDHAAFGYFADAYDFEIPGAVVPGDSTLAQPSSAELEELADVIRETGVDAIFANSARATDLIDALADEVGEVQVVELYVGTLGEEGSGAETYAGMMATNARLVAQALAE